MKTRILSGFFKVSYWFLKRYNVVIEGEHAKKCFLEIGDKWIFSTHGQNFRGGIQLHGNKQVFSFHC